jgi:hypothetical protein
MARYPPASWRPIQKSRGTLSRPLIICAHTMVGSLAGTDAHFRRVGVDSHFGIGNGTDGANDGAVWQWVDTARVAFANFHGNSDVISIETADGGNPSRPWSPKALDSLVNLVVWLCRTHNVQSILINGNPRGRNGLAYHRQGNNHSSSYRPRGWPYDQWRVSNGVLWSSALGKVCPGDVRIRQWVDVVLPRVRQQLGGSTPAPPKEREWWEMSIPKSELVKIANEVWFRVNSITDQSYGTMARQSRQMIEDLQGRVESLEDGSRPLVTSQQTGDTVRVSAQVAHAQNKADRMLKLFAAFLVEYDKHHPGTKAACEAAADAADDEEES